MRRLAGRVAVVTGAAGGVGRAVTRLLARKGCDLALVDVDEAGMAGVAAAVRAAGRRASTHVTDVSDRSKMASLPEEVLAIHGHVHLLVNNAGVTVAGTFEEQTLDDFDWIAGINFWGVAHGCKFFLPYLLREDEGHIVNVSSLAGLVAFPGQTSYCATKFAVHGLSEALRIELARDRIGVTSVNAGAVRTNIIRASRFSHEDERQTFVRWMDRYGLPPERAALAIVRAIERNQQSVVLGPEAHLLVWLKRLAPTLPNRLLGLAFRRRPPRSR